MDVKPVHEGEAEVEEVVEEEVAEKEEIKINISTSRWCPETTLKTGICWITYKPVNNIFRLQYITDGKKHSLANNINCNIKYELYNWQLIYQQLPTKRALITL